MMDLDITNLPKRCGDDMSCFSEETHTKYAICVKNA